MHRFVGSTISLPWSHNERDGVSNHQPMFVYSTLCSGADQRKHQCSASLSFVRGIHRLSVNFPHKGPVTRKMFPFDDAIMLIWLKLPVCNKCNVAKLAVSPLWSKDTIGCHKFSEHCFLSVRAYGYIIKFLHHEYLPFQTALHVKP